MKLGKRMMDDLDREIEQHIAIETQDNIERGMSPEEARYAALRKFGNITRVKEETHAVWIVLWFEELMQDVRFGLRTFRKSPRFCRSRNSHTSSRHWGEYRDFQFVGCGHAARVASRQALGVGLTPVESPEHAQGSRVRDVRRLPFN